MQPKTFDRLIVFSLFFMGYWFFGNLYEEIVMIPNQLFFTYETVKSYLNYFHFSNPVFYFVPFTQMAVVVLIFLYVKCDDGRKKQLLKKASVYGSLAIILTIVIVTQINMKLFAPDFHLYRDQLYTLSVWWLLGNALRIFLVGKSLYFTFRTFVARQARTT